MTFVNQLLLFALPVLFLNSALNMLWSIRQYDYPLDLRKHFFDHKRILGESSTLFGVITTGILSGVYWYLWGMYGFLLAWGALCGHMLSSFIKRRCSIEQGRYIWWAAYIDGALVAGSLLLYAQLLRWEVFIISLIVIRSISPLMTYTAYRIGLRAQPK